MEKLAKAVRLKGEGFKPGEWKNKKQSTYIHGASSLWAEQLVLRIRRYLKFYPFRGCQLVNFYT
jgi:hypothetical protein